MCSAMCPAHDPKAPQYACWQRITQIIDREELARCQRCPHGRALMQTVKAMPDAEQLPEDMPSIPVRTQADPDPHVEQKEHPMTQQTYTYAELAELLGYKKSDISNARYMYAKGGTPRIGSHVYKVLDEMQQRGITWEQVVPNTRIKSASPRQALPAQECASKTGPKEENPVQTPDDWSLDRLIKAVQAKLPHNTAITIKHKEIVS